MNRGLPVILLSNVDDHGYAGSEPWMPVIQKKRQHGLPFPIVSCAGPVQEEFNPEASGTCL